MKNENSGVHYFRNCDLVLAHTTISSSQSLRGAAPRSGPLRGAEWTENTWLAKMQLYETPQLPYDNDNYKL